MKRRVTIVGSYGTGNVGDDAILLAMLELFDPARWERTVLTADAAGSLALGADRVVGQHLSAGVSLQIAREFDFLGIAKAVARADLLVIGGGALLHDLRPYNLPYFFSLHGLAKAAGAQVAYLCLGAGPLRTPVGKALVRRVMPSAACITLRDAEGAQLLRSVGLRGTGRGAECVEAADAVFALRSRLPAILQAGAQQLEGSPALPERYVAATVCGWWRSDDYWRRQQVDLEGPMAAMARLYDHIVERTGLDVVLVPTVEPHDREVLEPIRAKMRHGERLHAAAAGYGPQGAIALVAGAEFVVGMRLHSMIFATLTGRPFFALSYDPKVDHFLRMVGSRHGVSLEKLLAGGAEDAFDEFHAALTPLAAQMAARADAFEARVRQTAAVVTA